VHLEKLAIELVTTVDDVRLPARLLGTVVGRGFMLHDLEYSVVCPNQAVMALTVVGPLGRHDNLKHRLRGTLGVVDLICANSNGLRTNEGPVVGRSVAGTDHQVS
jgi:hypothetical protein